MKQILLSAFGCNPYKGSESASGWNWAIELASQGYSVHVLTRSDSKPDITKHPPVDNLHFHFIGLNNGLEKLYTFSIPTMYLYYILWQWKAYRIGKSLHNKYLFHRVHHVSWGSFQQGSFLYKIKTPFIFGPTGGGQKAPESFKEYFLQGWENEIKREKISALFLRFNPACRNMLKKSSAVLVSNTETMEVVRAAGAPKIFYSLDSALSSDFFPKQLPLRNPSLNRMRLLWVGRFMPRKGLPLVIEAMSRLKENKGITLTIVGDGELNDHARRMVSELGLNESVKFTGLLPFSEVRNYYNTHDVFFFTSLRDSGPAQLIEAMAFGLPVVCLNLHGQGYIVSDKTGIRVPVTTPSIVVKELADAINYLASNPQIYERMSRAAYEFARQQEWSNKVATTIRQLY
ncbi:glycosyltransferase family 4 protein [Mangrovibacterium diazotrophicum]|uniref:Glycosyltransferase involved in cell wall biosynthesis n=1 Tax=Mangrovibacterium diazotrophicum TaxID=1261403 RepID=A0A419W935_9BACT|nr:glycosyltransferase family 4 protein [Mangrovibacterium diazotrophicum]RKD91973.1 glycosyltransferase involved in cell wall biosynthesis [Mangrovibacterium diazotrophicum]